LDNTVKIGDFGLVSAFGEDKLAKKKKRDDEKFDTIQQIESISSTTDGGGNNELGGTILYMSPEQVNLSQSIGVFLLRSSYIEIFSKNVMIGR
jgi:serine/threonine protein kinase